MAHLLRRLFAPIPAGALALGLVLGLTLPLARPWFTQPTPDALLPLSYVGVLMDSEGMPGLVVSARRLGRQLNVQHTVPLRLPDGRTLYLWAIEPSGAARRVGPLPPGPAGRLELTDEADTLLASAVELAVSVERTGAPPDGPAGAFVFRGACERMWRVSPPTPWVG